MTSDPLSLLRAGLDEDERIARAAADHDTAGTGDGLWFAANANYYGLTLCESESQADLLDYHQTADTEHITRQSPKATLDRVEAIRKVIAEREAEHTRVQVSDPVVRAYGDGYRAAYDRIAGILASIYAPEPTETGDTK